MGAGEGHTWALLCAATHLRAARSAPGCRHGQDWTIERVAKPLRMVVVRAVLPEEARGLRALRALRFL